MNRKFLEDLGLEKETIDKIMAEHGKAIQSAKPEDYDTLKEENKTLQGTINELNKAVQQYDGFEEKLAEKDNKIKEYELKDIKYRVATENGIPIELANRLKGETEEELKADAETFSSFVPKKTTLPLKNTEPAKVDDETTAYKGMLENLKLD